MSETTPATGGRYLRDPETGALTPADETPVDPPVQGEATQPVAEPAARKKGT